MIPDPSSTSPFPLDRQAPPDEAVRARPPTPPALRFSPLSFALGLLVGITFTSCLAGLALVLVVLSA